jgi:hypothetical protein
MWCFKMTIFRNGAYEGRTYFILKIKCEGSSYNATVAIKAK